MKGNTYISDNQDVYSISMAGTVFRGDSSEYEVKLELAAETAHEFTISVDNTNN